MVGSKEFKIYFGNISLILSYHLSSIAKVELLRLVFEILMASKMATSFICVIPKRSLFFHYYYSRIVEKESQYEEIPEENSSTSKLFDRKCILVAFSRIPVK